MKRITIAFGVLFLITLSSVSRVQADKKHKVKGPAAEAAAKLKNHPPNTWIKHYLGADRYKIKGGIWKVVSTQTDKYFHRANCPKMLRQSPNHVIGFPSATAALAAGYLPDPYCKPQLGHATSAASGKIATHSHTVRLSDGKSTITLPAGWQHFRSRRASKGAVSYSSDVFIKGRNQRDGVGIVTLNFPGFASGRPLTAANAKKYAEMYNHSGHVNTAIPRMNKNTKIQDITLNGMRGVKITPKAKRNGDAAAYIFQKGSQLTIIFAGGKPSIPKGASAIIHSYQPR